MFGEQITEALYFSLQLYMFLGSIDSVELVIVVILCRLSSINLKFEQTKFNCQFWLYGCVCVVRISFKLQY